jgi:hypothetical protein
MAVIAPVHAELEFHRDPGRNAQNEVDPEQGAPELGHLPPDKTVGHDIDRLHDGDEDRKTQGQGHEEEVIHGCHRKLQARQLDDPELHLLCSLERGAHHAPPDISMDY